MLVTPSSYWSSSPLQLASVVAPLLVVPASMVSKHPSPSESVSKWFGVPSPSVSPVPSVVSKTPSLSSSKSKISPTSSPSESVQALMLLSKA